MDAPCVGSGSGSRWPRVWLPTRPLRIAQRKGEKWHQEEPRPPAALDAYPRRYVICTGVEGLADALQSVLCTISWARKTGRRIIVNWRGLIWSGSDGSGGDFGDYFELYNRPGATISHNRLVWAEEGLPPSMLRSQDVWPLAWRGEPMRPVGPTLWIYNEREARSFDCRGDAPDPAAAIVVHPNILDRCFSTTDMANHIRLRPWLARAWIARRSRLPPKYQAVHLRGTDRMRDPENARNTLAALDAFVRDADARPPDALPIVVLSDDRDLDKRWGAARPQDTRMYPLSCAARSVRAGEATHYETATRLATSGVTKRQLNMELILDFLTLADSAAPVWRVEKASLFSSMASAMRETPRLTEHMCSSLLTQPPPAPLLPPVCYVPKA